MDLFGVLYIPNFLLTTLAVPVVLSLYFYGRRAFGFFTEHGIKGPKPTAYLGNLKEISQKGFVNAFLDWTKEYGDNYGIFLGSSPNLVIGDPEIIGEVIVKKFYNFANRRLAFPLDKYSEKMVLFAKDEHWKYLRAVLSPSYSSRRMREDWIEMFYKLAFSIDEYKANILSLAKDEHWKYLRAVLSPSYSSRRMREMAPLIEEVIKNLENNLNKIADSKEATDVTRLFSGYTMDVIASTGFGIKVHSQENPDSPIVKNAQKIFALNFFASLKIVAIIFPFVATIANWLKQGVFFGNLTYFADFCKELMKERKQEKNTSARKDLLQLMLDAQLEGHEKLDKKTEQELKLENVTDWRTKRGLKDVEIIAQCMVFFFAGFETTASTLSFFAHSIAMNPDIQEKLCQEIEEQLGQESPNYDNVQKLTYLDMCMDETLRMYPIAIMLTRGAKEDCIIKGLKIPKNSGIIVSVKCLHYDPRYWTEPEKFDPERFSKENKAKQTPFTYLPFGGGPRICAGMRLASLEFKMAVVKMLRKFRLVVCDKTEKKIEFAKLNFLKPKGAIWIKVERR